MIFQSYPLMSLQLLLHPFSRAHAANLFFDFDFFLSTQRFKYFSA